jgi:hypothetical protein
LATRILRDVPVCMSVCNNSIAAERILVKFDIHEFYWAVSNICSFGYSRVTAEVTLHEDPRVLLLDAQVSMAEYLSQRKQFREEKKSFRWTAKHISCRIFFPVTVFEFMDQT